MSRRPSPPPVRRHSRGAALLLAMILLTLVATVAAGMVWQQSRAIEVEGAERARAQATWMLLPGVDLARDVARRLSNTTPGSDLSNQPWDMRIDELKLSTLLAADRDNSADAVLDVTLTGSMVDAQSRYNLTNLFKDDGKLDENEVKILQRLCQIIGLGGVDSIIVSGLQQARDTAVAGPGADPSVPLMPRRFEQLAWLGLDPATLAQLRDHVDILPTRTPINVNTAQAAVIAAVLDIDEGSARGLVRNRGNRYKTVADLRQRLPQGVTADDNRVAVTSTHLYAYATLRYEDRALSEQVLLQIRGGGANAEVAVLRRERRPLTPT